MTIDLPLPELSTIVKVVGAILGLTGMFICFRLLRLQKTDLGSTKVFKLGVVTLPAIVFYKLLAFGGLIVVPAGAIGVANYHIFEGVEQVEGCLSCHVMRPMGNDMRDPRSETLAARHFRNRWIAEKQCYQCHVDYGLSGTLEAKMDGYRHLARYTTRTYREPIEFRGIYNNRNCLRCHEGARNFEAVASHHTVGPELGENEMSCLNCHGAAHPTRAQRTPGNSDYDRLMKEFR